MIFTNCLRLIMGWRYRLAIVLFVSASSLLLDGCSTQATKQHKSATNVDLTAPAVGASALPAGPKTPNPYLQQRVNVSAPLTLKFTAATQAMSNKQWSQAQTSLQSIVAADPSLSGAHLNLGLVYSAQGELAAAEKSFNAALAANPNNLDAYNQLAIAKREAGEFDAAEKLYLTALQHWGFHPQSHKNIAILYDLYLNKPELALPHYEAYLELIGGADKQALSWIADLQRRLGIVAKPKAKPSVEAAVPAADVQTDAEVTNE